MWMTKWFRTTPEGAQTAVHDPYDCHVIPVDDTKPHETTENCWCAPVRDDEPPYALIHNSADGREKFETGERKPS